jgi:alkanesulfonate monooxygenase SsuD/methylene tetrahydromethanopterin reductase-like flavin-dependent oxidoreductase (luciferase family)
LVKFGLYLNQYTDGVNTFHDTSQQLLLLEEVGFDGVFVGERHVYKNGFFNTLPSLATLVFNTKRIDVGTDLLVLPFYHPLTLAEILAWFDRASNGRLIIGLGIGYRPEEFDAFGLSKEARADAFAESISILDRLLRGEQVTFQGKYFRLKDAYISPLPLQRPRPPIFIGGYNRRGLRRAARLGDGWVSNNHELPEFSKRASIYRKYLNESGDNQKSGRIIYNMKGFCAQTMKEAQRILEGPLFAQYEKYSKWGLTTPELDFKKLADTRLAIGRPEDCIERLAPFVDAGADYIVIRTHLEGMSQQDVLSSIRLFGTRVFPYFRERD